MGVIYDIFFTFIHMFIIISILLPFPRLERLVISRLLRLLPPRPLCLLLTGPHRHFLPLPPGPFPSPLRLLLTRPYHLLLTRPLHLFLHCHEPRPYRSSFIYFIINLLLFYLFSLRCFMIFFAIERGHANIR